LKKHALKILMLILYEYKTKLLKGIGFYATYAGEIAILDRDTYLGHFCAICNKEKGRAGAENGNITTEKGCEMHREKL
jgi:hypothetical protein